MNRIDIINKLISHKNLKTFVEVSFNGVSLIDDAMIEEKHRLDNIYNLSDKTDMILMCGDIPSQELSIGLDSLSVNGVLICVDNNIINQWDRNDVRMRYIADLNMHIISKRVADICVGKDKLYKVIPSIEFEDDFGFNKYVICCIARLEKNTIIDWLDYHLNMGFDKVVLYDNNFDGEDVYDELLNNYISNNQLEIIDTRNLKGQQCNVYNDFFHTDEYKWLAVFDCDEYFAFKDDKYTNIRDFISMKPDAHAFLLPWLCEHSKEIEDTTPYSQYNNPLPDNLQRYGCIRVNFWPKTFYKHGSFTCDIYEHTLCLNYYVKDEYNIYDDRLNKIESMLLFQYSHMGSPMTDDKCVAYFKHFLTKDINEFFYNKYLRGNAGVANSAAMDGYCWTFWNQNLNYFVEMNRTLSNNEQMFLLNKGFKLNIQFRPTVIVSINVAADDPQYYDYVAKFLEQLQEYADILFLMNIHKVNGNEYKNITDDLYNRRGTFGAKSIYYGTGLDLPKDLEYTNYVNYYNHEFPIIHIGYPGKGFNKYKELFDDFLLNRNKIENILRDILFRHQTDDIIYTPNCNIEYSQNCLGWLDQLDEYCKEWNVENKRILFSGNIFITNTITYNQKILPVCNHILYHTEYNLRNNDDLIRNHDGGYTTPYHLSMFMYPNVINTIVRV